MIAWAGMERLKALEAGDFDPWIQKDWLRGTGVYWDEAEQCQIEPMPRLPIGRDISKTVEACKIKVKKDYTKEKTFARRAFFRQRAESRQFRP